MNPGFSQPKNRFGILPFPQITSPRSTTRHVAGDRPDVCGLLKSHQNHQDDAAGFRALTNSPDTSRYVWTIMFLGLRNWRTLDDFIPSLVAVAQCSFFHHNGTVGRLNIRRWHRSQGRLNFEWENIKGAAFSLPLKWFLCMCRNQHVLTKNQQQPWILICLSHLKKQTHHYQTVDWRTNKTSP